MACRLSNPFSRMKGQRASKRAPWLTEWYLKYYPTFEARLTECLLYHRMDREVIRKILLSLHQEDEDRFLKKFRTLLRERKAHFFKGKITGEEFLEIFKDPDFAIVHARVAGLKSWHYIAGPLRWNQRGPGVRRFEWYPSSWTLESQKKIDPIINKYF